MKTATIPELALVVLIGPSGSGKSSFAPKHFRPTDVLSSDVQDLSRPGGGVAPHLNTPPVILAVRAIIAQFRPQGNRIDL